ncbi:MAG: diguanylate cyclase [Pirellulales bacterium]|nr:diguanylate cyclase [Pirellulales bacterium]
MTSEAPRGNRPKQPVGPSGTGLEESAPASAASPTSQAASEVRAERRMSQLTALLESVEGAPAPRPRRASLLQDRDNQLPLARLGVAAGLFAALRAKHADTAAHSLRVTLGCSAWSLVLGLPPDQRDALEVASLLHDIGKIGVPDAVLLKPASLTPEELLIMQQHRVTGLEILRSCCHNPLVLDIVAYATTWYQGERGSGIVGEEIPLPARMLAIVDAFDAMTSNQLYRRPLSCERAIGELFRFAGTQFDPNLVEKFAHFHDRDQSRLQDQVAQGWLRALQPEQVNSNWSLNEGPIVPEAGRGRRVYHTTLLEHMQDGVAFVDSSMRVVYWNRAAERLTGITAASILQRTWTPRALELSEPDGTPLTADHCPIEQAMQSGGHFLRRLSIRGRNGRPLPIELQVVPVEDLDSTLHGATLLMHDVSPQTSLEARCQNLHELATRDPLTQVANRAEFDRVLELFVIVHLEQSLPCSLIICDIDRFKKINDTFGHPAGDEVIKNMARLLKRMSRPGDLVARYGGEEFLLLCAGCDNATAARRAEELRHSLAEMPQPALGDKRATASFGVTELQPGDTPETMLRRADRALLYAKEKGRNTVVQLGSGIAGPEGLDHVMQGLRQAVAGGEAHPMPHGKSNALFERSMRTSVPLEMSIEKLRGFVADHHAEVISVEGNHVKIYAGGEMLSVFRRGSDRPIRLVIDLVAEEEKSESREGDARGRSNRTILHVSINPLKGRDRRVANATEQARKLGASLQAYLMAEPLATPTDPT